MENLRINRAVPGDVEALLPMMADFNACEGIPWKQDVTREAAMTLVTSIDLGSLCCIFEGHALVGYFVVTWGYDLEYGGRDAFLTELYVCPGARGRGLGESALAEAERIAEAHGARALHLMVRPENEAAVKLYRRAGYESSPRTFLTKDLAPQGTR